MNEAGVSLNRHVKGTMTSKPEATDASFRHALHDKVPTVGSWLTLGNTATAEIMVRCGFDWLVIDMEHSPTTSDQAQQLIRVVDLANCIPLVRVNENRPALIKQAMDAGAHGVVVPMVNSAEEAVMAVRAVRYSLRSRKQLP